jgi:hypothetical protein
MAPDCAWIHNELKRHRHVTLQLLWEEYADYWSRALRLRSAAQRLCSSPQRCRGTQQVNPRRRWRRIEMARVRAIANEDIKSNGQVMVKKGSKLMGHVTAARPIGNAKGSADGAADSQLGIVFDRAVLKDGREVPLNASIQALAAAQSGASAGMDDVGAGFGSAGGAAGSARSGGGGLVGGVAGGATGAVGGIGGGAGGIVHSGASGTTGVLGKSAGAVGGLNATGQLSSGSKGVFGMKGVDIASATAGSAQGSVLSSSARNVRLDRGTRMLLVNGSGAGSAAAGVSKGASSASGSAAGAASAAGTANSSAVNAAGSGAGTVNAAGAQSRGATSAESNVTATREPTR